MNKDHRKKCRNPKKQKKTPQNIFSALICPLYAAGGRSLKKSPYKRGFFFFLWYVIIKFANRSASKRACRATIDLTGGQPS